jgi:putative transposase
MARQPRLDLPGIPQHLVQRGNDRQACFAAAADYQRYLQDLREASCKHDCAIHAYVLMTNHVHLLVTPTSAGAISRMMQAVGRRYVGSFNARYQRTGTLWEGRFKAALVDTDPYLLTCYRYIELNPVRARMTDDPSRYPWSSYHHNALGQLAPLITPHEQCTLLASTPVTRQVAYRALVHEYMEEKRLDDLRLHTQQQRAWGSQRFQQQIEALTQRAVGVRPRGRPSKSTQNGIKRT